MNKLIVRLNDNSESLSWHYFDANNSEIKGIDNEFFTESANLQSIDEAWLIVPGSDVLLSLLPAPLRLRRKQFCDSVPYLLEEKLGEDIETLHFVTAKNRIKDKWPVAVVKKALIEKWLELLAPFKVRLSAAFPDYLLLPFQQDHWTVFFEEKFALVRTGACSGFCVETDMLLPVLYALVEDENIEKPSTIQFLNYALPNQLDETKLSPHNITVHYDNNATEYELIKSAVSLKNLPLNLLQGPFEAAPQNNNKMLVGVVSGFLMIALLSGFIVNAVIQYYSSRHELERINQQLVEVKSELYPDQESSDFKGIMQKELASLQKLQQQNQFLALLLTSGEYVKNKDQIKIDGIEYRNENLYLNLELKSFEILDQLTKSLQQKKLIVKREYARSENNVVKTRLSIAREKL